MQFGYLLQTMEMRRELREVFGGWYVRDIRKRGYGWCIQEGSKENQRERMLVWVDNCKKNNRGRKSGDYILERAEMNNARTCSHWSKHIL